MICGHGSPGERRRILSSSAQTSRLSSPVPRVKHRSARDMFYLYLVYGAVFVATGVLLAFQSRLPPSVVPSRALWWLSGAALSHGVSEWLTMSALVPDRLDAAWLRPGALVVRSVSFVLLAQFAFILLGS